MTLVVVFVSYKPSTIGNIWCKHINPPSREIITYRVVEEINTITYIAEN